MNDYMSRSSQGVSLYSILNGDSLNRSCVTMVPGRAYKVIQTNTLMNPRTSTFINISKEMPSHHPLLYCYPPCSSPHH